MHVCCAQAGFRTQQVGALELRRSAGTSSVCYQPAPLTSSLLNGSPFLSQAGFRTQQVGALELRRSAGTSSVCYQPAPLMSSMLNGSPFLSPPSGDSTQFNSDVQAMGVHYPCSHLPCSHFLPGPTKLWVPHACESAREHIYRRAGGAPVTASTCCSSAKSQNWWG